MEIDCAQKFAEEKGLMGRTEIRVSNDSKEGTVSSNVTFLKHFGRKRGKTILNFALTKEWLIHFARKVV